MLSTTTIKSSGWQAPHWRRHTLILLGFGLFAVLFPLAFVHYEIYVDEAWLGQQVHALVTQGIVKAELFRDVPPLNDRIVLYHKLLIWGGAAVSCVAGWGLYALRTVSLLSGLLVAGLLFLRRPLDSSPNASMASVLVLLFTPLFFHQMIIFRPEMLVTAFGFAGFLLLERGILNSRLWLIGLAGLCAGLSGATHAAGLSFAAAGFLTLLLERRYSFLPGYLLCAALGFFPYVLALVFDRELFLSQTLRNNFISTDLSVPWWQQLVGILDEHKRWFRKPEVIGISVLFLLALLQQKREEFQRNRTFWLYLASLSVIIAATPLPKLARYMMPLIPFLAIVISRGWMQPRLGTSHLLRYGRVLFIVWTVLFFIAGIIDLGYEALIHRDDQIATNRLLAAQMEPHTIVMAPWDFIFEEQPNFTVQGFSGVRRAHSKTRTAQQLEAYADSCGANYMILSTYDIDYWRLDSTDLARSFKRYTPLAGVPTHSRWLVRSIPVLDASSDSISVRK